MSLVDRQVKLHHCALLWCKTLHRFGAMDLAVAGSGYYSSAILKDVSVQNRLSSRLGGAADAFVTPADDPFRERGRDGIRSIHSGFFSNVIFHLRDDDEDIGFARGGGRRGRSGTGSGRSTRSRRFRCRFRRLGRLSLFALPVRLGGGAFFESAGVPMIEHGDMRIEAAYVTENQAGALPVAGRDAANPVLLVKADQLFAGRAFTPISGLRGLGFHGVSFANLPRYV
jgi:hypothetical protein